MYTTTYFHFRDSALQHLHKGELFDALTNIEGQINFSNQPVLRDQLRTLQEDYALLLNYYKQGANDTSRYAQRQRLTARAYELSQLIDHRRSLQEEHYRTLTHRLAIGEREEMERLAEVLRGDYSYEDIFNVAWTSYGWNAEIDQIATAFLFDEEQPYHRKTALVGAVLLSLLSTFEAHRYEWMLSMLVEALGYALYDRLLLGVVLVAMHHEAALSFYPRLLQRFAQLSEEQYYAERLAEIQGDLLGILETPAFSKKMVTEIMPQLLEVSKDFPKTDSEGTIEEMAATPEQQRFSKIMMEVFEKHSLGIDTSYPAFQKTVESEKFFHHAAHWFGAYETSHPEVAPWEGESLAIEAIGRSKTSSDTDRFATLKLFVLTELQSAEVSEEEQNEKEVGTEEEQGEESVPRTYPRIIFDLEQVDPPTLELSQHIQTEEQQLKYEMTRDFYLRSYVQDLYRFFHLFPHRHEKDNPFRGSLYLMKCSLFASCFKDFTVKWNLAVRSLNLGRYDHSLFFLADVPEREDVLYLKLVSLHRLKRREECFLLGNRLLEINPNHEGALRTMIACCRRSGRTEDALVHLLHLESLLPNDWTVAMSAASVFSHLGLYDDVIERCYKVLYHEEQHRGARVNLGWALLNARRWEEAEPILMGLLDDKADANDYLNAGHLHWVRGQVAEAAVLYGESLKLQGLQHANLTFFDADKQELLQLGMQEEDLCLMVDLINGH